MATAPATGLVPFDFAWNQLANVLYVDAPAGVGFSFSNDASDYSTGDAQTADDNLRAIQEFLKRFPEQSANDLYLSSESYGGHYVPTLAAVIIRSQSLPNFKGFLLGNPLTDIYEEALWGQAGTLCGHSLASAPTCANFTLHCLGASGMDAECPLAHAAVVAESGDGIDTYGLDYPTCPQQAQARTLLRHLYPDKQLLQGASSPFAVRLSAVDPAYDPCLQSEEAVYMSRADVHAALRVSPKAFAWQPCTRNIAYNQSDFMSSMEPLYTGLLASKANLRMLIFSGDDDSVCATLGTFSVFTRINC